MTDPNYQSAVTILAAERPTVARLDINRHPEETAADLIDLWSTIENALRSLLGGPTLSGQALVGAVRERNLIPIEQAHALLACLALHDRLQRPDYRPTADDVQIARDAFNGLDRDVREPRLPGAANLAPPPAPATEPARSTTPSAVTPRRGLWLGIIAVILAILLAGGGFYYSNTQSGMPSDVRAGIANYNAGRREAARAAFAKAAREYPTLATPHIYLARLAREDGDFATAGSELKTAIELDPTSALAERELGAFFLARGTQFANQQRPDLASADYNAARRAYVRALTLNPADTTAQGFLGCSLVRLGRMQEATTWLTRAGSGPWSACAKPQTP